MSNPKSKDEVHLEIHDYFSKILETLKSVDLEDFTKASAFDDQCRKQSSSTDAKVAERGRHQNYKLLPHKGLFLDDQPKRELFNTVYSIMGVIISERDQQGDAEVDPIGNKFRDLRVKFDTFETYLPF